MPRSSWVNCLGLLAALVGGALLGLVIIGVLVVRSLDEFQLIESHGPVDVAEARRRFSFDYPDSARKVQFAFFRQFIALDVRLRFEAPADDCRAAAERVIAEHNAAHPDRNVPGLERIRRGHPKMPVDSPHFSTDWFDVDLIENGLVGESREHKTPRVWVDLDRGIFYYLETD